ncbi:MAG: hypothetical protein Q8O55_01345 [Dehalococcoidales bacterium]|nr:hypothetical protein [Dehalococcoidales bacterium]
MAITLKKLTPEEVKEHQRQFLGGKAATYALKDGSITLSFHDTEQEARAELRRWQGRELIQAKIEVAMDEVLEIAKRYGLGSEEARDIFHKDV